MKIETLNNQETIMNKTLYERIGGEAAVNVLISVQKLPGSGGKQR
jgi:hypothetical protein